MQDGLRNILQPEQKIDYNRRHLFFGWGNIGKSDNVVALDWDSCRNNYLLSKEKKRLRGQEMEHKILRDEVENLKKAITEREEGLSEIEVMQVRNEISLCIEKIIDFID